MLPVARVIGHKEWAPGRKSDPTYDMNWRRAGVAGIQPRSAPMEDDMPTAREIADAILDTPITRQGELLPAQAKGATTSLRNEIAYMTNESYRAAGIVARIDSLARLVQAGGVDPAVVQSAVVSALGGGLDITGTAVPHRA